jgi:hypothetical protein
MRLTVRGNGKAAGFVVHTEGGELVECVRSIEVRRAADNPFVLECRMEFFVDDYHINDPTTCEHPADMEDRVSMKCLKCGESLVGLTPASIASRP